MNEDIRAAAEAAERLISRLQEIAADHLGKTNDFDGAEAFYQLVQALETAPEITTLRTALGRDPYRFGERTPLSRAGHTG